MASVCLINYNARIYDPQLGRFLSADPTTEAPDDGQDWNRYSYVLNNPLAFTDPSGLCFLGCFWQQSWFRDIVAIAAVFALQQWEVLPTLEGAAFAESTIGVVLNGGILGGIGGAIATGTVKGAALGILQGALFAEAGNILQDNPSGFIGIGKTPSEFIAHGFVGGIVSLAGGGKFGSGFLAGGVSSLGPSPNAMDEPEQAAIGTVEHAILGGLGSVLGGGKFQNGAITGAFGYLFNECLHGGCSSTVDIGGHVIPKSLLMAIQQDIASRSLQIPGTQSANEWSGYILDDLTYRLQEGTIGNGGPQSIPDSAIIQFHSHPPYFGQPLDSASNQVLDFASKCSCDNPEYYGDIEVWASYKGWGNVTGAIVFGPTGAYAYDLRNITMQSPQYGSQVLTNSEVSWPLHH